MALAADLGGSGGRALKDLVTEAINEGLRAHRERRAEFARDPSQLTKILRDGNARAETVAAATLNEVRTAMSMDY